MANSAETSFDPQMPEEKFEPVSGRELEKTCKQQLRDFSDLVDQLDGIQDKKKMLWKQIYENAITDRMNAYLVFADLYINVHGNANMHAVHGMTLAKYLERMSKANDQILKLAELVANAEEKFGKEETFTEDDLYDQINKRGKT